jgi:hypothetical protein
MSNPKSRTTWRRIPKRASAVAKMLAAAPSAASREIVRSLAAVGIPRTVAAKTPKKDVIGLLQLAAELEHALMVQYLYAAASVHGPTPEGIDAGRDITIVAIQEMGHLVTVQNLLLAIADVDPEIPEPNHYHHLGRDRLRAKSKLNPMPFVLEPISHSALAKYVTIERPPEIDEPALRARVEKLGQEAKESAGTEPHPVWALYAAIYWIFQPSDDFRLHSGNGQPGDLQLTTEMGFQPGWHLAPGDYRDPAAIDSFATVADEWPSAPDVIFGVARNAQEACSAVSKIVAQGEGPAQAEESADSHFKRFLNLLDRFESNQLTVKALPRTPFVEGSLAPEDPKATLITNQYTTLWGRLFNLRYSILLLSIGHALFLPRSNPDRKILINYGQQNMKPVLVSLTKQVLGLELRKEKDGSEAGPTYGLLDETLPDTDREFWVRHKRLFDDQTQIITAIQASPEYAEDDEGTICLDTIAEKDGPVSDLLNRRTGPG